MKERPFMHRSSEKKTGKPAGQKGSLPNKDGLKDKISRNMPGPDKGNSQSKQKHELTEEAAVTRKIIGFIALAAIVGSLFFSSTMSQQQGAEEIANRTSTEISSGFVLADAADVAIESQDFAVDDFRNGNARMLIWDFTGDTEDQIQIVVDGQVIRESHTLTSNVSAYSVPVPSVVTIQGLEDQAHYAVKFPERKSTIFNIVAPGGANSYTLTPNPLN